MSEIDSAIEKYNHINLIAPGSNQDADMEWGSLCCQLAPLLLAERAQQALRIEVLKAELAQGQTALRDIVQNSQRHNLDWCRRIAIIGLEGGKQ